MSSGVFTLASYGADNTDRVYPIKVQPETLTLSIGAATNAAAGGAITEEVSARVSGSRRSIGLHARTVRVRFTGTAPTGYETGGTITLPILTPTVYAGIKRGDTGTYLGATVQVVGKSPEVVR